MCSPTALFVTSALFTVGAGVVQAQAADRAGRYNQRVAENNAVLSEQKARDATIRGERAADEQRLKTRMLIGQQRASLAANGVTLDSGTSLDILGDTAMMGAVDEETVRLNAAREAWGYRAEASNYRAQGALDRYNGKAQKFGTLLGTAANVAGGWQRFKAGG